MLYASIATIAIFISCILSATLLLFHQRKEASHLVWAALSYTVGIWALGLCLTINAQTYETALFWGRFHNYVAILIIPLFVHFVYSLIGQKSKVVYWVYLYFCVLLVLHLVFFKQFIPSVHPIGEFNFYIQEGSLYWIFLVSYFSLTTFGALRLAIALPKTSGLKRKQFTYILAAFSLGFIGGGTTFPMAYGLHIYPFGLGAIVVYVLLITYAIIQYRVFDVSNLVANTLSVMFTLLALAAGYVAVWEMYLNFIAYRTSTSDLILNVLYLVFACESYLIVRPKLHAFNKTLLTKRHYSYEKIRESLVLFGEDLLEPQALIRQAQELLSNDLKLPITHFFISKKLLRAGQTEAAFLQWSIQKERFDSIVMPDLEQRLLQLTPHGINISIDEADQELKSIMKLLDAGMFLPFVSDEEFLGMAFIAKRKGADLYTSDDFLVFDLLSSKIEASLGRALSHLHSKSALLSLAGSIAHEIRNPLSQIKSSLDGIEKNLPLPTHNTSALVNLHNLKNLYEYVSVGGIAIKRGLQVISMILDEVKEKPIDPHTFNYLHAAQATQKAIDEYGYETESERSKITLEIKNNFVFKGDETLFLFVLFNLIKNALYYFKVKPNAKITITIDQHQVIVRDTGPGIPSDRLPYLFNSFQTSGKQGGTGLGLSYCKRVMQSFGGDIYCQSMLGEYTEFVLDFPEVPPEVWQQYQHKMIERIRPILYGRRVLIVDDDETIRASTQVILNDIGIHSTCAEHGQMALEKLAQSPYDLIILDLNMPVLDGYATAEKIRSGAIPGYEQIPIIAYTTEVAYMAKVKTQKVGIHTFVSKPCESLILLQTMETALTHAIPLNHTKNKYAPLIGKTVLIADDSEASRKLLSKMLEEYGVRTLEAEHGAAVCRQLESINACDAVLMDLYMPGMNGVEATRQIRHHSDRYQSIPIILITGATDEASMTQAHEVGVTDYITKPIEIDLLLGKLLNVCQEKQTCADAQTIPLFNLEKLDFFKSTGIFKHGSDNSFVKQTKEHLLKLEQSIRHNDFKKMKDALHFLKGSSWTVGALAFAELIQNYEHQIKNGQLPEEKDWFEKIKDLHAQTLAALQAYFG